MPKKAYRVCYFPRCNKLTHDAVCKQHLPEHNKRKQERLKQAARYADNKRESSSRRGYNSKWRKARKTYLNNNPLCVMCKADGRLTDATVVDHITAHKGDSKLFWDSANNWQALCHSCHSKKTVKEDGALSNRKSDRVE